MSETHTSHIVNQRNDQDRFFAIRKSAPLAGDDSTNLTADVDVAADMTNIASVIDQLTQVKGEDASSAIGTVIPSQHAHEEKSTGDATSNGDLGDSSASSSSAVAQSPTHGDDIAKQISGILDDNTPLHAEYYDYDEDDKTDNPDSAANPDAPSGPPQYPQWYVDHMATIDQMLSHVDETTRVQYRARIESDLTALSIQLHEVQAQTFVEIDRLCDQRWFEYCQYHETQAQQDAERIRLVIGSAKRFGVDSEEAQQEADDDDDEAMNAPTISNPSPMDPVSSPKEDFDDPMEDDTSDDAGMQRALAAAEAHLAQLSSMPLLDGFDHVTLYRLRHWLSTHPKETHPDPATLKFLAKSSYYSAGQIDRWFTDQQQMKIREANAAAAAAAASGTTTSNDAAAATAAASAVNANLSHVAQHPPPRITAGSQVLRRTRGVQLKKRHRDSSSDEDEDAAAAATTLLPPTSASKRTPRVPKVSKTVEMKPIVEEPLPSSDEVGHANSFLDDVMNSAAELDAAAASGAAAASSGGEGELEETSSMTEAMIARNKGRQFQKLTRRQLDHDPASHAQRRAKHPIRATIVLRQTFMCLADHPYPSDETKTLLAEKTQLSRRQINDWFTNSRKRFFLPYRGVLEAASCSLLERPFEACKCDPSTPVKPPSDMVLACSVNNTGGRIPVHFWLNLFEGQLTDSEQYPIVPPQGVQNALKVTKSVIEQIAEQHVPMKYPIKGLTLKPKQPRKKRQKMNHGEEEGAVEEEDADYQPDEVKKGGHIYPFGPRETIAEDEEVEENEEAEVNIGQDPDEERDDFESLSLLGRSADADGAADGDPTAMEDTAAAASSSSEVAEPNADDLALFTQVLQQVERVEKPPTGVPGSSEPFESSAYIGCIVRVNHNCLGTILAVTVGGCTVKLLPSGNIRLYEHARKSLQPLAPLQGDLAMVIRPIGDYDESVQFLPTIKSEVTSIDNGIATLANGLEVPIDSLCKYELPKVAEPGAYGSPRPHQLKRRKESAAPPAKMNEHYAITGEPTRKHLMAWFEKNLDDPYPTPAMKDHLVRISNLSYQQVSAWLINARMRIWKPLLADRNKKSVKQQRVVKKGTKLMVEDFASEDDPNQPAAASSSSPTKSENYVPKTPKTPKTPASTQDREDEEMAKEAVESYAASTEAAAASAASPSPFAAACAALSTPASKSSSSKPAPSSSTPVPPISTTPPVATAPPPATSAPSFTPAPLPPVTPPVKMPVNIQQPHQLQHQLQHQQQHQQQQQQHFLPPQMHMWPGMHQGMSLQALHGMQAMQAIQNMQGIQLPPLINGPILPFQHLQPIMPQQQQYTMFPGNIGTMPMFENINSNTQQHSESKIQ